MTAKELFLHGVQALRQTACDDAPFECDCLLESATGIGKSRRLADPMQAVSASGQERFSEMLCRRLQGEPLQYILGKWSFYRGDYLVRDNQLVCSSL